MKQKKYFIIVALLSSQLISLSQKTIKISVPCTDEVLFKTPGKWFMDYGGLFDRGSERIPFNKAQVKEATNRMDLVREMLFKLFPEPMGVDIGWYHSIQPGYFGEKVKYVKRGDRWDRESTVERHCASFSFICGFYRHGCNVSNPNEIRRGYPGETGTWFGIHANSLGHVAIETGDGGAHMIIDGQPVHLRQPLKQAFDGYELFYRKANVFPNYITDEWKVLIHRKGELPYTPVTRKQYLEKCTPYITQFYDDALKEFEKVPMRSLEEQEAEKNQTIGKMKKDLAWNPTALKASMDSYLEGYKTEQQIRKEQLNNFKKDRDAVMKHYTDEIEETTKKGLLESPAIIPLGIYNLSVGMPIFVEENVGAMVVIENIKYMRKDLPKYVPQFFAVSWSWGEYWKPQSDVGKLISEKFPFEKLQVMIDK